MGYTPPDIDYKIDFDDPEGLLDGIEVTSKGLTFSEWSDLRFTHRFEMIGFMLTKIISWNLEDRNGNPVPPTVECDDPDDDRHGEMIPNTKGLDFVDPRVMWAMYTGWRNAVADVEPSAPLEPKSVDGELSGPPPIQMEPPGSQAPNSETHNDS